MAEGNEQVRPRIGELRRRGEVIPVRFVQTSDEMEFLAVTVDGERIALQAGDQLLVDVLGPGQRVSTHLTNEPPEDYDYRTADPS